MGITVRQAVTGLVDEIAARFRRDPWRSVDTGVDHRHRHPGPGRELVGIGHARYVLLHGGSWNPDPGSVVGDAHKTRCSVG